MNFSQIAKEMNKSEQKPIAIKVNKNWYEKQLQQSFVLRKPHENPIETFTNLPVQFDDKINTFEFVYN